MAQRKGHRVRLTTITHIGVRLAVLPLSGGLGAALKTAPMRNIRSRVRKCKLRGPLSTGLSTNAGCQVEKGEISRPNERGPGSTMMVESVPRSARFRNGETRLNQKPCEMFGLRANAQAAAAVNQNEVGKSAERRVAPRHGFEPRLT
jgi:hypothetical protein